MPVQRVIIALLLLCLLLSNDSSCFVVACSSRDWSSCVSLPDSLNSLEASLDSIDKVLSVMLQIGSLICQAIAAFHVVIGQRSHWISFRYVISWLSPIWNIIINLSFAILLFSISPVEIQETRNSQIPWGLAFLEVANYSGPSSGKRPITRLGVVLLIMNCNLETILIFFFIWSAVTCWC